MTTETTEYTIFVRTSDDVILDWDRTRIAEALVRETEIQTQVILLLSKELQQARLQESRDISSLTVVDPPFTPTYKARPKRIPLFAIIVLLENGFLFLLLTYRFYFSRVFMKNERVLGFLQAFKNK